ncbi:MAG: hypothetical protein ACLR3A_15780, partial [Sellimonas intestinalis]
YRHLPTYEKIIRNLVSFYNKKNPFWQDSPPAAGRFTGSFHSAAVRFLFHRNAVSYEIKTIRRTLL